MLCNLYVNLSIQLQFRSLYFCYVSFQWCYMSKAPYTQTDLFQKLINSLWMTSCLTWLWCFLRILPDKNNTVYLNITHYDVNTCQWATQHTVKSANKVMCSKWETVRGPKINLNLSINPNFRANMDHKY